MKRARDGILSSSVPFSIKRSKDDSTSTTVSKECLLNLLKRMGTDHRQDSGKFIFIINDALLDFFIVLQNFFKSGIDKDIVIHGLKYLSESKYLRTEWRKVVGDLSSDKEEAGSVIILQRITSMFAKSKQQIIREQLSLKPQKQSKSLRRTLSAGKK